MSVPEPSMDLNEWDLATIDQLMNYPSVESETFDFKGAELSKLETHICAMANTSGGILVLGIEEPANKGRPFVKSGFEPSRKNSILNDIRNYVFMVEPHPKYDIKPIDDPATGKFYVVLKVEGKSSHLPHGIKDRGQYYVRVGASTSPASPTIIANLFSDIREKMRDVNLLRSSCLATRNAFILTGRRISYRNTDSTSTIPPVDLDLLKKATIQAEWFLIEKDLLGVVFDGGSNRGGMYIHLDDLALMNSYIESFNRTLFKHDKEKFLPDLKPWGDSQSGYTATVQFLERVIKHCEGFLKEHAS